MAANKRTEAEKKAAAKRANKRHQMKNKGKATKPRSKFVDPKGRTISEMKAAGYTRPGPKTRWTKAPKSKTTKAKSSHGLAGKPKSAKHRAAISAALKKHHASKSYAPGKKMTKASKKAHAKDHPKRKPSKSADHAFYINGKKHHTKDFPKTAKKRGPAKLHPILERQRRMEGFKPIIDGRTKEGKAAKARAATRAANKAKKTKSKK